MMESHKTTIDPRVALAAERTLLAWLRTGLSMMGFGFVVARLGIFLRELGRTPQPTSVHLSFWVGTGLVLLSTGVYAIAVIQHMRFMKHLRQGTSYAPSKWSLGVVLALILAALGIGLAVYLLRLSSPL